MWRLSLTLLGAALAVVSTAGAQSTGTVESRREQACKILLEARAVAHEIGSPADRNLALGSIAQTLIRAGDEAGALAIDKDLASGEIPRPILKSLALAQLHAGRFNDALFTVRTMKDPDAVDMTLISLAEAADESGDPEMAVRMCRLVSGDLRLDALLLATRVQHNAADLEGEAASLDAAKLLAHHQAEIAKVAETEALLGNLKRADHLMARLRRESDQSRVMAAMVAVEAAARDFENADAHLAEMNGDSYKATAMGAVAVAHAEMGQMKEAVDEMNAIPDSDVQIGVEISLTEMELKRHGTEAGKSVALACQDAPARGVCLSIVAARCGKIGRADDARAGMSEAQRLVYADRQTPMDRDTAVLVKNMAEIDMAGEAIALVEKMRDSDMRTDAVGDVTRMTACLHGPDAARKLLQPAMDARERTAGLVGIAAGLLDDD